jgi:hypothetical protein
MRAQGPRAPRPGGPYVYVQWSTVEVERTGTINAVAAGVRNLGGKKPYIDVVENVFGGVRISTEDEAGGQTPESDIRARPWLSGLTVSAADVRLIPDEEPKKPSR